MKGKLMVLAALAALVLSPVASALAEGFYVTPKVGFSHMKAEDDGNVNIGRNGSKNIAPFGLAVGYDFKPDHDIPVRAEFEYAWRGKKEFTKDSGIGYEFDTGVTGDYDFKAKLGAQSFFVNAYFDIHNSSPVTPYIGLGLGLARVTAEYQIGVSDISNGMDDFNLNHSKTKTNFSWNIGAGAAWKITDSISLDLGYRYADFGKVNPDMAFDIGLSSYWSADVDLTAHEVLLGLRFGF